LYNILNEFDIPMKVVQLTKISLNVTYSKVTIGKHLSYMYAIKNGLTQRDTLPHFFSTLLYKVCH